MSRQNAQGTIYLIHFSTPYKHAKHYTGWALDLKARLAEHEEGRGARLLQVIKAAGISWRLARTWPGDRQRERELKNMGGASRRCPHCGITPQADHKPHSQATRATARDPQAQRPKAAAEKEKGGGQPMTAGRRPPQRAADALRVPGGRPPEYVVEAWVSKQLRDRSQRDPALLAEALRPPDPDQQARAPLAERQAEP